MPRCLIGTILVLTLLATPLLFAANAKAPNIDLSLERRTFAVGQKAAVGLSLYNLKQAQLSLHRVPLEALAPTAAATAETDPKVKGSLPNLLNRLDLKAYPAVKTWTAGLTQPSVDYWDEKTVRLPAVQPGVYVLRAMGGGAEKRTWLAISSRAVLIKRSPREVLAWVVNSKTGQPAAGVPIALYGEKGKLKVSATTGEGLVKFEAPPVGTPAWVAAQSGDPAFGMAESPSADDPYYAYLYMDRPVYRPAQAVRFRGTVREWRNSQYSLPTGLETVRAQIKTDGGSTVYDEQLPVNEWGSFNGEFQLAPEPPLGDYEIVVTVGKGANETSFWRSFRVEAYRKPEFTVSVDIDKDYYIGGERVYFTVSAKYFFGSPVSGGKVKYEINFSQAGGEVPSRILTAAGLGTGAIGAIEDSFEGEGRLDKNGELRLYLPTKSLPFDRYLNIRAEVSETALRPRSASDSTSILSSAVDLSVSAEPDELVAGETLVVKLKTTDREGKPVSTRVNLSLIENLVDREGRAYEETTKRVVETGSDGRGETSFVVKHLGSHQLEAWAQDKDGNPVFESASFEVVKKRSVRTWPSLELSCGRVDYSAGQTAEVKVETDQLGAWMLVTVQGQRLYSSKVYKIGANSFNLKIPVLEEYRPGVSVNAAIIRKGALTGSNCDLSIPFADKKLQVIITPNKEKYQPAETASYTITTRDSKGVAVPAEVGLGVVDASVYEIRSDDTPDIFGAFWEDWGERVETAFSLEEMYPGGAYQTMAPSPMMEMNGAGGGKAAAEAPRVRRFFTDTAFWGPSVVTGPDGSAEVEFLVPDNLTTWRATARGLTKATQAGENRRDVIVTMPLLVRFTLPRFYVAGDEATAAATVHNYTGTERTVKVTLSAEGAELLSPAEQTIKLANDAHQRLTWKIRATGPEQARLLVSADGGPGGKDAMESTLPVKPDAVKDVQSVAGLVQQSENATLELPANAVSGSGLAEITLSPSLAGPIFEALDYLTTYPYGCAEQTMDGFLPNMIVVKTLRDLGSSRPRPKMLDRYISFGLQKLLRFQHSDGGWHWWEFDESDPYISAYIVYGLKLADMNGYVAAHSAMVRGTEYLRKALDEELYRDAQAYLLWALAFADVWPKADDLKDATNTGIGLFAQRAKLDLFSRASLALSLRTLARVNGQDEAVRAQLEQSALTVATELEAEGKELGTAVYWPADGRYKYSWLDNNVEVTSQVLSALLTVKPGSQKIVPAVRWLMAAREGKAWTSTKDTAAAVLVLTKYLEQSKELGATYTARVLLNDKLVRELRFTPEDALKDPVKIAVPALDLRAGANRLRLEKTGAGNLYYSARLSYLLPSEGLAPIAKGITIERRYRLPAADPSAANVQDPGEVVFVDVTVRTKDNLRYALLQEPIPAGCEVIDSDEDRIPSIGVERREVWDSKLVLYFNYLPRGERTFSYALRTEAPGSYRILPTSAELMYFPEVRGSGRPVRLRIADVAAE